MSLSCSCNEWDGVGWAWCPSNNYSLMKVGAYRKKCVSCGALINFGDIVLKFHRFRATKNDIEDRIYGCDGEIPLAPWYHCEECADLYFSLEALGFCAQPDESMRGLVDEYAEMVANID